MMDVEETLLRAAHSSLCITFGTTSPFKIDGVRAEKIGFAQIPCVVVTAYCPSVPAIVPIVRQRVFAELAERGWDNTTLAFTPGVRQERERIFVDENQGSPTVGRRKRGFQLEFRFEIVDPELKAATFPLGQGSFSRIPDRD